MTGKVKRTLLNLSGVACLSLGAAGFVLPVVPASPFLILAAWCFARSNNKLYEKLRNNRLVGRFIREFSIRQAVRNRVIRWAQLFLWLSVIISLLVAKDPWIRLLLLACGAVFSLLLRRMKHLRLPRGRQTGKAR